MPRLHPYNFLDFIYLFIFGYAGSLLMQAGFPQLQQVGATLQLRSRLTVAAPLAAEHRLQGMWALVAAAPWLNRVLTHPDSIPQHVGSSQTRDQTCVPCTGRCILNHWTTREVTDSYYKLESLKVGARYVFFFDFPSTCIKQANLRTSDQD